MSLDPLTTARLAAPPPPVEWNPEQKRLYYLETLYTYCRYLSRPDATEELLETARKAIKALTVDLMALDGATDEMDYCVTSVVGSDQEVIGKAAKGWQAMFKKLGGIKEKK